jgi:hypothetical protein
MLVKLSRLLIVTAAIFMLFVSCVRAQNSDAIDTFFQLSGLEQQIRDLPSILIEQFNEEKEILTPASQRNILLMIEEVFNPDLLVQDARNYLMMVESQGYIDEINAWLDAELTQRMNELETASNEDVTFEDRDRFFAMMEENRPSEVRLELVNRLETSTEATYYLVSIITDMYLSLIQMMSYYMPPEDRISAERFPDLRYSIMNELLPMYRDITFAMNLYTYREVSDEDLAEYVSFYETEAGRWFADVSYEVINHVLMESRNRISTN